MFFCVISIKKDGFFLSCQLPDDYNEIAYSNLSGNNGLYSRVIVTDAQMPTHQTQEMV